MAKSAVVFVANGCEPVEVVAPVDALRRGGVDVVLAAVSDDLTVRAAQAVTLQADAPLSTLDLTQFDIAIVPGGSVGVDNLGKSQRVVAELTRRMEAGEYVAAICAGPMVLANAGCSPGARPCATRAARKAGRSTSTRRARTSSSMETLSLPRAPARRCPSASKFYVRLKATRLPMKWLRGCC